MSKNINFFSNHPDFDHPRGSFQITDETYEKTKSKIVENKIKNSNPDPMQKAAEKSSQDSSKEK